MLLRFYWPFTTLTGVGGRDGAAGAGATTYSAHIMQRSDLAARVLRFLDLCGILGAEVKGMRVPDLFAVYSPPFESGGYYAPPEYGSDYLEVWAYTKRQAITMAGLLMRKMGCGWVEANVSDGVPPWKGLKADRLKNLVGGEE